MEEKGSPIIHVDCIPSSYYCSWESQKESARFCIAQTGPVFLSLLPVEQIMGPVTTPRLEISNSSKATSYQTGVIIRYQPKLMDS